MTPGRVCILGGSGFIGQATIHALLRRNESMRIVSRHAAPLQVQTMPVEWNQCDYGSTDSLVAAIQGCDSLIHLAGSASPARAEADPVSEHAELNTTQMILDAAQRADVRHLVYVSSGGTVYGEAQQPRISEDHPTHPVSVHGVVKLAVERLINAFAPAHGLHHAILRVGNAYGEHQNTTRGQGLIGVLLRAVVTGERVTIFGDGSAVRDYVHVDDIAAAIVAALDHHGDASTFNVGTGMGHSVRDVISLVETLTSHRVNVEWQTARRSDVQHNVLDISRITQLLNWKPARSLEENLRKMVADRAKTTW